MAKYLDLNGLREFWSKTKDYLNTTYAPLQEPVATPTPATTTANYFISDFTIDENGKLTDIHKRYLSWDNIYEEVLAEADHSHGNLANDGTTTASTVIGNNDGLVILKTNYISGTTGSDYTFNTTVSNKYLNQQCKFVAAPDLSTVELSANYEDTAYQTKYTGSIGNPTSSGKSISFVDSLLQDTQGKIQYTTKQVNFPDYSLTYATADHTHTAYVSKTGDWEVIDGLNGKGTGALILTNSFTSDTTDVSKIICNVKQDRYCRILFRDTVPGQDNYNTVGEIRFANNNYGTHLVNEKNSNFGISYETYLPYFESNSGQRKIIATELYVSYLETNIEHCLSVL